MSRPRHVCGPKLGVDPLRDDFPRPNSIATKQMMASAAATIWTMPLVINAMNAKRKTPARIMVGDIRGTRGSVGTLRRGFFECTRRRFGWRGGAGSSPMRSRIWMISSSTFVYFLSGIAASSATEMRSTRTESRFRRDSARFWTPLTNSGRTSVFANRTAVVFVVYDTYPDFTLFAGANASGG